MSEITTPIAVDQLGQVFGGRAIGYHVTRVRHGGYLLVVDGNAHSAHTTLAEAISAMGQVAANEYSESPTLPEHARDVTQEPESEPIPQGIRPGPPVVRPPELRNGGQPLSEASIVERAHATAIVAVMALVVIVRNAVGV